MEDPSPPPARTRFDVGAVRIDRITENGPLLLRPGDMFPDAPADVLSAHLERLQPHIYDRHRDALIHPVQGFLLRIGRTVIVVDTCAGDFKNRATPSLHQQESRWLDKLQQLGVSPEMVDYVICTHLHVDHVGWNTRLQDGDWVPTFPDARYLFVRDEWDYLCSADGHRRLQFSGDFLADSVKPVVDAGLVDFIAMDHEVLPEVGLTPAGGHSPGQVCVDVRSSGDRLVLAADVLHTPLQCALPHWSTRYCVDQPAAARTRAHLLSDWATSGTRFMPSHFPEPSAGFVEQKDDGFRFRFSD